MAVSAPLKSPITGPAGLYRDCFASAAPFKLSYCAVYHGPCSARIQSSICGSAMRSLAELCSPQKSSGRSIQPIRATKKETLHVVQSCKRALISLSDKRDLAFLANGLQSLGYSIVSTAETTSALEVVGVSVTRAEELTFYPKMLDVTVKAINSNINDAIRAGRDDECHIEAFNEHGIDTFDVVVVNLYYVFGKVSSTCDITFEDIMEYADFGRRMLIQTAIENHKDVLVVVDHEDYPLLLKYLQGEQAGQDFVQRFRKALAWKAANHVASYSSAISEWLWKKVAGEYKSLSSTIPFSLERIPRYGETPHQTAAYGSLSTVNAISSGIETALNHHGKKMPDINYLAAIAAWNCVSEFKSPTCVIVKHSNPCGVASRNDILEAYRLAVKADPVSAFGGVVAFNTTVDEDLAKEIREFRNPTHGEMRVSYEIIVAPKYTEKGLEILRGMSKRILDARKSWKGMLSLKQGCGGWLDQDSDDITTKDTKFNVMSQRVPREDELGDAEFAWRCVKHVKSNAIVIAKNNCMLGIGSGQPTRLESLRIALGKAGGGAKGAALASDFYFPFAWEDAVEEACQNGIAVVAEPGGGPRDGDAVDCCNKYGVSLLFTKERESSSTDDDYTSCLRPINKVVGIKGF